MGAELEKKINASLENFLRDAAGVRGWLILMAGISLVKADPVISGICVVAGLVAMMYDTEKMQRK